MFAQDQVAPLPPPARPVPLTAPIAEITGDSHQHLFTGIARLARELGYTVCVCDAGAADGTCNRKTREIEIAERLSPNGRLAAGIPWRRWCIRNLLNARGLPERSRVGDRHVGAEAG